MLNTKLLGGTASKPAEYVEDVFSTYLYTGNGSSQTINNGIDLAGKGGLVWEKQRTASGNHLLYDSARGTNKLSSNLTDAQSDLGIYAPTFNSNGFTSNYGWSGTQNLCTWTFRKAPKFFDIVTYTGTGSAQNISHNLGSVPGMIIIKRTDGSTNWRVYHRGLNGGVNPEQFGIALNTTFEQLQSAGFFNNTAPTSTVFTVNTDSSCNTSGGTYVAYLFAHDAGGFGAAGTDNVISCGSFSTNASTTTTVNLGYEPQFVMVKLASGGTGDWYMMDTMRGLTVNNSANTLSANSSSAEVANSQYAVTLTSTGFTIPPASNLNEAGYTYIYMAIRRPMKVPTDATKVYTNAIQNTGTTPTTSTTGFPVDLIIQSQSPAATNKFWSDRLRGSNTNFYNYLISNATSAESTGSGGGIGFDNNTGFANNLLGSAPLYNWTFRRASGFFDVVCYTGTGSATTFNHNLGVVPELMIVKERDVAGAWRTYVSSLGNTNHMVLNSNGQVNGGDMWNSTNPTSTVFSLGTSFSVNRPAGTFVNYLFATCPGVSKVGSYTGNGTTQSIACGFTGGARFVMIKRTDAAGDWYTYDTARGMTTVTDPYLLMNTTDAEVATLGSVTTSTGGFSLNSTILADINISGGNYIFLAIA